MMDVTGGLPEAGYQVADPWSYESQLTPFSDARGLSETVTWSLSWPVRRRHPPSTRLLLLLHPPHPPSSSRPPRRGATAALPTAAFAA